MALINCDECGKKISSKAEACPQCGAPVGGSIAPPLGSVKKGITTRPDFWHDPNVGAVGCLLLLIVVLALLAMFY
jgi:uncharacterized membrane protein YvbJ